MRQPFFLRRVITTIETAPPSDRFVLRVLLTLLLGGGIWFLLSLNNIVSIEHIRAGGQLEEGIVGTPRFVNPALALTRADRDITALVYSGLLRYTSDGQLVPDLAETWTQNDTQLTHRLTIRKDATFHDEQPVTADDVAFTIKLIQNENLKSPLHSSWSDVEVEVIDTHTLTLTLSEPYASFADQLTLGILPAHIWRDIPIEQVPFSQYNTTPIGTGPYQINDVKFSQNGTVDYYQLTPYSEHTPTALISHIITRFYGDEDALVSAWVDGDITSTAYLPPTLISELPNSHQVSTMPLSRVFGLFYNQHNSTVLRDQAVRSALSASLNPIDIINTSLAGAGTPSPFHTHTDLDEVEWSHREEIIPQTDDQLALAHHLLTDTGWKLRSDGAWIASSNPDSEPLSVTIRTANTPVLDTTLEVIARRWEQLGIQVAKEQFSQTDLVQSVIRERDFEVLLFGIDPGRHPDWYPFWHSSEQDFPGLNITQYTNITVDTLLESARRATTTEQQQKLQAEALDIITTERPASLIFQPTVQYVHHQDIVSQLPSTGSHTANRFTDITSWYSKNHRLWPIFTKPITNPQKTDAESE